MEETLVGTFIGGLKAQIQVEVLARNPDNLLEAFDEAKVAEQCLFFTSPVTYNWTRNWAATNSGRLIQRSMVMGPTTTPKPSASSETLGPWLTTSSASSEASKTLSQAEIVDRRKKGICFSSDKKWNPEHECQLHLMVVVPYEKKRLKKGKYKMMKMLAMTWQITKNPCLKRSPLSHLFPSMVSSELPRNQWLCDAQPF